jgi:hypothetical protein
MHSFPCNLLTAFAAATADSMPLEMGCAPVVYEGLTCNEEIDGARNSEIMFEDRNLLAFTGALPSEVWA